MEIRGLTLDQLEKIARHTPVVLYNARLVGQTRKGEPKIRLQLHSARDSAGRVVYGRRGFSRTKNGERRALCGCVCWHGHRDFMLGVFEANPTAIIVSAFARYDGRENFERLYHDTGDRQVGSQYDPAYYSDLCDCDDDAGIYFRETKRSGKPTTHFQVSGGPQTGGGYSF